MYYRNKIIYLTILVGIGSFFVFTFLSGFQFNHNAETPQLSAAPRQVQLSAQPKRETPVPAIVARPVLRQKNPVIQQEPDRMAQLEDALRSKDEAAIQTAIDGLEDCADCLELIATYFDDPIQNTADKIALGKALMQPATQAETLILVNIILNAHLSDDVELKAGLLQALGNAQTPESAAALITVITKGVSDLDFYQLPEDLQLAIQNAIRLNPFPEATGQMLTVHYNNQASPDVVQELENIQQPVMLSMLAKQAYNGGDIAKTEHLTHLLTTIDDPHTLDGLMLLGVNDVMTIDETNGRAYVWVSEHAGAFDQDHYAAYLSNFDTNATQRSAAAFALAASQDSASVLAALEKASLYETDPLVSSNLVSAINLLLERTK